MIKKMVSSNGRRVTYRAQVHSIKVDFGTFAAAFQFVQDRLGSWNRPVIKGDTVVWWNKRFEIVTSRTPKGLDRVELAEVAG